MGGYESKEFDRLKGRGFRPYSEGHQRMYTTAIEQIGKPVHIFEAGFGIGFGLQQFDNKGIILSYLGCEPNVDSFHYVRDMDTYASGQRGLGYGAHPHVWLLNDSFDQSLADKWRSKAPGDIHCEFDEAFCIEVIEHVPMHLHLQFLIALRQMAPRLWFSSPDKDKSKEGVRTTKEWSALLKQARFDSITVDQTNWTYLYEAK